MSFQKAGGGFDFPAEFKGGSPMLKPTNFLDWPETKRPINAQSPLNSDHGKAKAR